MEFLCMVVNLLVKGNVVSALYNDDVWGSGSVVPHILDFSTSWR
jgi:hypothetical protein